MNPALCIRFWAAAALFAAMAAATLPAAEPPAAAPPKIQVAILLDTSNSMDGLINQARSQLWRIVNEFATATRHGQRPRLEVALYEYGNDGLPAAEGHLRLVVPLTEDLDRISEELFKLTTNGGQEYCGQVIDAAVRQLRWSDRPKDLKCIFICGNEPFTQGEVDFREACRAATAKNITVSTIFCGAHEEGVRTHWEEGARLADGSYMSINQEATVVAIDAPQDKQLAELSARLNATYLPYGAVESREEAKTRQAAQDLNAAGATPEAVAQRALAKASALYRNTGWDLVDAVKEGAVRLDDLKEEELPEELRGKTLDEQRAILAERQRQREALQAEIQTLSRQRDAYLAEQRQQMAAERPAETLDAAVIDAVRAAAAKVEFEFEK